MKEAASIIQTLLDEAIKWRDHHKARGRSGQIEALGASIRIKAFKDALRALESEGR